MFTYLPIVSKQIFKLFIFFQNEKQKMQKMRKKKVGLGGEFQFAIFSKKRKKIFTNSNNLQKI